MSTVVFNWMLERIPAPEGGVVSLPYERLAMLFDQFRKEIKLEDLPDPNVISGIERMAKSRKLPIDEAALAAFYEEDQHGRGLYHEMMSTVVATGVEFSADFPSEEYMNGMSEYDLLTLQGGCYE